MRALNGGKRVLADAFQCTLMIGNPGVGKSTLLNAVVVQLRTTGPQNQAAHDRLWNLVVTKSISDPKAKVILISQRLDTCRSAESYCVATSSQSVQSSKSSTGLL
jgi:predicted ATPase